MRKRRDSDRIEDELTPAQVRELRRRVADLDDATRYILVSQMGPRFALYYNVSEDVYAMNDPNGATLFRRNAAVAIKKLLGGSIRVVECASRRDKGVRVPVLKTTRARRRARVHRRSSNRRSQPTAGTARARSRSE
jgi:hypothetical protein